MPNEKRIDHIKGNLSTCSAWTRADYAEFYERDVLFLLAEVERLRAGQFTDGELLELPVGLLERMTAALNGQARLKSNGE